MMSRRPLNIRSLHPYAAFTIYDCNPAPNLTLLSGKIVKLLRTAWSGSIKIIDSSQMSLGSINGWVIHFKKKTQASWTDDPTVLNVEQHILLLVEDNLILGISTSASEVRGRVGQLLSSVAGLSSIPAKDLEVALLRSVPLRTLWLTGIHRKSPFKADSKVLTGSQLQTALSPLDDRTFRPSSGRADTGLSASTGLSKVGVSPKRSYAWIGPTENITDFVSRYTALVSLITSRRTQTFAPLPILAQALLRTPTAGTVFKAFDFAFVASETTFNLEQNTKLLLEEFELRVVFNTIGNVTDQGFTLYIKDLDHANTNRTTPQDWKVEVTVDLAGASATAVLVSDSLGWPRWGAFQSLLKTRSLWSVWYETKHSLGSGEWNMLDARASSFAGEINPVDFSLNGWDITSEKPLGGAHNRTVIWRDIGNGTDKSLFSWWIRDGMQKCFPNFTNSTNQHAFAICDDGSNELADFIVVAKDSSFATPTNSSHLAFVMVHIKSSSSDKPTRGIAPKQYEEVLGQATKNLGRVHFPDTCKYLLERFNQGLVMMWEWSHGQFQVRLQRGTHLPMASPIRTMLNEFDGRQHHVHVVVVQPHQSKGTFLSAMNQTQVDFKTHMLCTLLCAGDGAVRATSAKLTIVMSP